MSEFVLVPEVVFAEAIRTMSPTASVMTSDTNAICSIVDAAGVAGPKR
jgi:hypothetical protein